ncbi:nucleolin [Hordeum vulgare]|nr:nucleolin [Hordeum vulgare]
MSKSGDDKMIRGYSINMLHHLGTHTQFRVMDLIVETVKRTAADQKRSYGYAPYIQMIINAKIGKHAYLLDRPHLPLQPEFEYNEVVMDSSHPSSTIAQEAAEAA